MASSRAVLLPIVCVALAACSNGAAGVRVALTRIHPYTEVTASEFVRHALRRDMHRHAGRELAAAAAADGTRTTTVSAPIRTNVGEYLMTLSIGTPPLAYPASADTGSDLIWTQCAPCLGRCFKQPVPLYSPSRSSTFGVVPCNSSLYMCAATPVGPTTTPPPPRCPACQYNLTYGTGWTAGRHAMETFTFGSTPADQTRVPGIVFGCSDASSADWDGSGAAGLVGLGRGKLSLVSQLGAGKFSYCLTPFQDTNSTSTLLLGPSAALALNNGTGAISSTPFVANPSTVPMNSYYYLNLTGISIGTTALPIPPDSFSLRADGTGGLIIDSGTTITMLVDAAYQQVRAAVQSLVTLPLADASKSNSTGLDLCFALPPHASSTAPPAMLPSMMLHFDGADMVLPVENYMTTLDSGVWCLAMAMQNQTIVPVSIFGNYQQQNMHFLFDVQREMLSFAPAKCSTF